MSSARSPQPTWTERLKARSPEPSESSWQLRVLAQLLVIIGIIATDTAAETTLSFWAIPASVVGATWSWHNRDKRNITVKFLLAIGMIVALVLFFRNLLWGGQLNDTRVALTSLLVQIQLLHSFDLPRRKDLGYSMIIGLILISVACTLSQTMGFGLWLLLFLAIALPVLVMDYRSRLGLKRWEWAVPATKHPTRRLTGLPLIFGTIVGLGLLIFAVMPRLPSYQIQTFPMSAQIETQGQFEQEKVLNPGYIGQGKGNGNGTRAGRGSAPETGKGEVDDTFYYGFNTKINQNLRGKLTEKVVMRVRSQAEGFWRVMAFDRYNGQGWEISRNDQTDTLKRSAWNYQFYPSQKVDLNRTKRVVQTYTMVSDLPNVIPAMDTPREVYFPTKEIAIDREDGLRSPVPLTEGLTYTVISDVPYRDRAVLQQAQSRYPPKLNDASLNPYGVIEPQLQVKLQALATELMAQANSPLTSDYEKALFLAQAVKQRYSLQTDLPFLETNDDLVDAFFFKSKGGYPDHFATALTVLLRSIGLSTRLVTGFAPGTFNPFTGYYVVKNTDAYALTEVYFHKYGWFTFDPIPGHPLTPPSVEENQTFTALKAFWQWIAGWLPSPVTGWLNWAMGGIFTLLGQIIDSFFALFRRGAWGWLLGIAAAIGSSFMLWLTWVGYQRWRYWQKLRRLAPTARLYQQLTDWLAHQGLPKHPAQTPWEYARIVANRGSFQDDRTPQIITNAYLAWRYGGQTPDLTELQQSFRLLQIRQQRQWLAQLPELTVRRLRLRHRRRKRN
jgi:protein-glutamine gamma-glutamyltransferase